ncbi:molybdenum ABC transporter ATP-binding protein [Leptolinea sp. HRD-7]|nr:molybdenum ABC transporter ATP-binding protein [Leptolinea sp. HRD-7]
MIAPDQYPMGTPKILLNIDNIAIRSRNRLCFTGTSWQLFDDQQWALIGRTGSGKSILVKAICGKLPVVQGRIVNYFDGTPEGRPYTNCGEIVLVSAETQRDVLQRHALYHQARWQSTEGDDVPTLAEFLDGEQADDRLTYSINPPGWDAAAAAARREQAVDLLGIRHLLERKVTHLSNGEGRKALLARALTQSPKLLVLDDPFSGLDADSRKTLMDSLTAVLESRQQRLILVASREDEIPEGITHVLGIAGHKIAVQGEKSDVLVSDFARKIFKTLPEVEPAKLELSSAGWLEHDTLPPGTPLIEFRNASVSYKGVTVLHDITWTMRQGEHWAIRGPNGAGKSTLLSLILADNPQAYANDVTIFGRPRGTGESIWEIKQQIGWVSPEIHMYYSSQIDCRTVVCSGFHDSMGLYQNVTAEQSQTADRWMRVLGIDNLAEELFHDVSIGEQRLILLARALVKQPRLLILDEPCQGLDSYHRTRIIRVIDALCQQTPVSLLYVTHHRDELPEAITHVLQLEKGRIRVMENNAYRQSAIQ